MVIAIIGILVALLLPAVQSAREGVRRIQCSNNLKQLGLGCLLYHEAYGKCPPASVRKSPSDIESQNSTQLSETWVVLILPYLEQQNLYDSCQSENWMTELENRACRGTELNVMKCPSDTFNLRKYSGVPGRPHASNHNVNWARGNYAANGTLGFQTDSLHCSDYGTRRSGCAALESFQGWNGARIRGVMEANAARKIDAIRDGTSNTILILKICAGVASNDCLGCLGDVRSGCQRLLGARLRCRCRRP